jgi:hypothetical protein
VLLLGLLSVKFEMSPKHKFSCFKYNALGCDNVLIWHVFDVVSEEPVVPIFVLNLESNGGLFC